MDVSQLPFNHYIGLELASQESDFLVTLPDDPKYTNHVGTVHASALLAVAEAGSAAFLSKQFPTVTGFIPVVRQLEAKFRKPARGRVWARCKVTPQEIAQLTSDLATRTRMFASIPVEVVDDAGTVVMSAIVEWFISQGNLNS